MCPSRSIDRATAVADAGRPSARPAGSSALADPPASRDASAGSLRASDAERESAADELRAHAADGRLTVDELDSRLGAVLSARTRAEVDAVLGDLPAPANPIRPVRTAGRELHAYVAVMLLLLAIWALTGAGHFWPLYPALGWGLPLLAGRDHARRRRVTTGA